MAQYGKKPQRGEADHIEGNFNVPDVFMKTKYGSIAQYNYQIEEQNESEHDENANHREDARRSVKETGLSVNIFKICRVLIFIRREKSKLSLKYYTMGTKKEVHLVI